MTDSPLLTENYVAVKRCRHGLMAYNTNDLYIGRSFDRYGEWCESEIDLLTALLKPGDIVLDVGANIGSHTIPLAKAVAPSGVVFAIEPQRLCYQMLCGNVAINAILNVFAMQIAATETPMSLQIPVIQPTLEFNYGCLAAEGHGKGEQVPGVPIDNLGLPRCNLIKMDVEGMESKALRGAANTLKKHRPILFVENNTTDDSGALITLLEEYKYSCWWHLAHYYNPDNFYGCKDDLFTGIQPEANMLCFPVEQQVIRSDLIAVEGKNDNWLKAFERSQLS
ncbi:Uncharacterized protein SCG7086_AU_00160 [Chlamydiales bacterium SCGC AG-110-P3]|nr:Uncharacterized protein SCG7086_AU_00160 [Chlamydiales bacterium SCGC AG-110-P3]